MAVDNNTILGKVWLAGTNDFQQRIPNPDQSNMQAFMDALFDPMNRNYYNQNNNYPFIHFRIHDIVYECYSYYVFKFFFRFFINYIMPSINIFNQLSF